ncbi:I12R2 protein, partial [Sterrhoptilus dennistouni]|nr:I12R2 protein [Sterrhoptilus dennistouni]
GGSVSKTILVTAYGKHTFTCKNICPNGKEKIVCGIDIECGNPPDEPRNVSCVQIGTRGHPTCTWDKGRVTYLQTAYGIE